MSTGRTVTLPRSSDDEYHSLVISQGDDNDGQSGAELKPEEKGILNCLILHLGKYIPIRVLMEVWGPRLEFAVKLMLVATFFDDCFHTVLEFPQHVDQISQVGCMRWLAPDSPHFAYFTAAIMLVVGLLAQSIGALCLLVPYEPDAATKALIGWTIAQPVLYAQLLNFELVAESLSLIGGLLILRAHLVSHLVSEPERQTQTKLVARLLLPLAFLYHGGVIVSSAVTLDETNNMGAFLSELTMFPVYIAVFVGLIISSALVAAGLKSRSVSLFMALLNLIYIFSQHPFFLFIRYKGGEWVYNVTSERNYKLPVAVLPSDFEVYADMGPERIYELHRYYFFLGLSTSGALLLLAQYGPGQIAVQKDEMLLSVGGRAQDSS